MKVTLTVHGKELDGKKFEFTEPGSLIFGSAEHAHCRITGDRYVSRNHFLLIIDPAEVKLRDLNSTNGTEVDGKLHRCTISDDREAGVNTFVKGDASDESEEVLLQDGSQIEVGYTRLSVSIEKDAEMAKSPRESAENLEARRREWEEAHRQASSQMLEERQRQQDRAAVRGSAPPLPKRPLPGGIPFNLLRDIIERVKTLPPGAGIPDIPGYEIVGKIAEGGMGAVFRARKIDTQQEAAIKVILPDRPITREAVSRFRREIRITGDLRHPHIVGFNEGGEVGGLLWLALELVANGWDAERERRRLGGKIPRQAAVTYGLQALAALAFMHSKDIIHRDMKPSNVLLASEDSGYIAKVSDFGLAKSLEDQQLNGSFVTKRGSCMATLPYAPPEQIVDVRSAKKPADVFSMGATLYHMLTGCYVRNFSRRLNEITRQVVQDPTIPIEQRDPSIPRGLVEVINRSLCLDPKKRYADADAFRKALEPYAQ